MDQSITNDTAGNVKELMRLSDIHHRDLHAAETRRTDDLREADKYLRMVSSRYEEQMRDAEAKRLDSIRVVDATAVSVASDRAVQQANVLAAQVSASAETQRALVATTASALATQLQAVVGPMTERLASCERSIFEGQGKSTVVDPLMASMLNELKGLGTVTATMATRFNTSDSILASIVSELKILGSAVASTTGAAGVSNPLLIAISAGVGAVLLYVFTHIKF